MADDAVSLKQVCKRFGALTVLDRMSLRVRSGEIVALLGPSGCGKTTTLRLLAGLLQPDSGEVLIDGIDVRGSRPYERNIGVVFQNYALFPHMSVWDNIAYGLRNRGCPKSGLGKRVDELVGLVGLTSIARQRPGKLSGGQQQRVALARALATSPSILLLDEPLSSLDAKLRHDLRLELKSILGLMRCTTILVTHDQEEAMTLAERVALMSGGRIIQEGSPTELYDRPKNRFVAEFIGRSNWFSGTLEPDGAWARFRAADGISLRVPWEGKMSTGGVCVRPERMHVVRDEAAFGNDGSNTLQGVVLDIAPTGADVHITVRLPSGQRITVIEKYAGPVDLSKGSTVTVAFHGRDCIVVPDEHLVDGS